MAVFTIATSACVGDATNVHEFGVTIHETVLFARLGSLVVALTLGKLEINVPGGAVGETLMTSVKFEMVPLAKLPLFPVYVHEIVPFVPTAGVMQVQLAGVMSDTKVVVNVGPVGSTSVKATPVAVAGPLFVTVCA